MRTKEEIKERSKFIRAATPNCLEELFEMQNRICDLCGQPIQGICLAELDHSISVKAFAESELPVSDAVIQANSTKNLRAAHESCNASKHALSRDEWYAKGLNNRDVLRVFTELELEKFRLRATGLKNIEGGRVQGLKNSVSGHLDRIRNLPQTKEGQSRNARIQGLKSVVNGNLARIRTLKGSVKGGVTQGRRNSENGHLMKPYVAAVESGRFIEWCGLVGHTRWHTNRGIVKAGCKFCKAGKQE